MENTIIQCTNAMDISEKDTTPLLHQRKNPYHQGFYSLAIFLMFSQGKVSITLLLHKHFFIRSNIYLLSSTGKRWKTISGHFVRLLLQLVAAQHWPFDIQRRADAIVCTVARLKLHSASDCGVTRYREELRVFVKL